MIPICYHFPTLLDTLKTWEQFFWLFYSCWMAKWRRMRFLKSTVALRVQQCKSNWQLWAVDLIKEKQNMTALKQNLTSLKKSVLTYKVCANFVCKCTIPFVYTVINLILQSCDISMHILYTVVSTFPNVLTRRICSTIKSFFR